MEMPAPRNAAIFIQALISKACPFLSEDLLRVQLHYKDEQQGHNQGVNPGGLRNRLAHQHGASQQTRLSRVPADGLTSFGSGQSLTNTGADGAKTHRHARSQKRCSSDQISSTNFHSSILLSVISPDLHRYVNQGENRENKGLNCPDKQTKKSVEKGRQD
jgi:hypothetical protein